jgi:acetoin utilization deacetylase AcuC-like enzyme
MPVGVWMATRLVGPPLYFLAPRLPLSTRPASIRRRPERIQAIEAELEARRWLGYERREAPAAPLDAVTVEHSEAYVDAVRSRSASRGSMDEETGLSPGPT